MRVQRSVGDFRVHAIAGTRTVLIALDCAEHRRHGLLGFAFRRESGGESKWLRSMKVFKSLVPDPKSAFNSDADSPRISTLEHPVQSFLWGDYTAEPNTVYRYTAVAMYGAPGALEPRDAVEFEVRTEKEIARGHGVWFNRGAIASQAFAREFGNRAPTPEEAQDPKAPITAWLSRGLIEACLAFIRKTPKGDALRVAAYELTYPPVLRAFKDALARGVDVRIVYDDTTKAGGAPGANEKAIAASGLPRRFNARQVLFPRTRTRIPHNKFIVRLKGGTKASAVWTGSTNFTASGFMGQSNVGHLVNDARTAAQFADYRKVLRKDPARADAREAAMKLTPNPPALVARKSITRIFSPRNSAELLQWYAERIEDASASVMFTAAFGVAEPLVGPLAKDRDFLRFILMEKPPAVPLKLRLQSDRDCVISYGAVLGEMYRYNARGEPVARTRIKDFDLDKWLLAEDHYRHDGFVFFVHTKFLLIDPLSRDPLVCTGSANFSSGSLTSNDENMLVIRGDTRVADIYLTEFDRLFRHFYFRVVANEVEAEGGEAEGVFLDETSVWTEGHFEPGTFKARRREMFFAEPATTWASNAAARAADAPA